MNTTKIQMLKEMLIGQKVHQSGDIVEVDETIAKRIMKDGHALKAEAQEYFVAVDVQVKDVNVMINNRKEPKAKRKPV